VFDCDVDIGPIRGDLVTALAPTGAGARVRLALFAAFVSLVICSPAAAAAPEPGGRYHSSTGQKSGSSRAAEPAAVEDTMRRALAAPEKRQPDGAGDDP
jgi:hypothetical protein